MRLRLIPTRRTPRGAKVPGCWHRSWHVEGEGHEACQKAREQARAFYAAYQIPVLICEYPEHGGMRIVDRVGDDEPRRVRR